MKLKRKEKFNKRDVRCPACKKIFNLDELSQSLFTPEHIKNKTRVECPHCEDFVYIQYKHSKYVKKKGDQHCGAIGKVQEKGVVE